MYKVVAYSVGLILLSLGATDFAFCDSPISWPQDRSDLKADPAITFGALENGMRYEVQKNAYPPGRISLRFRINIGSRLERSDERGIAHVLEHMAFRGSTHFPDGTVIKRLSALGLRTGADANASTSETQTVFRIDLPNNSAESINAALTFFRDIADGLLLDPQALDSERKVVLSEARLADTPIRRMGQRSYKFVLASLHKDIRPAIGEVAFINSVNVEQLGNFYYAYYRPENTALIVVGDFDQSVLVPMLSKEFGDWRGRGEPRAVSSPDEAPTTTATVHIDTEWGLGNYVYMYWTRPDTEGTDSQTRARTDLITKVALGVLDRKYDIVNQGDRPPFFLSNVGQSRQRQVGEIDSVYVGFLGGQWRDALIHMDTIRRGALAGVLPQREIDAVRARILATYRTSAETISNHVTPGIAEVLLRDLDENRVSQSPAEKYEFASQVLAGLKAEAVTKALGDSFTGNGPLVWLRSTAPVIGGDAALQDALQAAQAAPAEKVSVPIATTWPYQSFGKAGRVSHTQYIADLDVTTVEFTNGIRLNLKKTSFSKDQVGVTVSIGRGIHDLPIDGPPIGWAVDNVFIRSGLKKIDYDSMQMLLADNRYGVSFSASDEAFTLAGTTRAKDLDMQLQILAAYCTAPAYRQGIFEQSKNGWLELIPTWRSEPYRELRIEMQSLLRSDDRRYGGASLDEIKSVKLEDFRNAIAPKLANAPIEMTIVGDMNVDEAIQAVARTFGTFKPRQPESSAPIADGPFPHATAVPIIRSHEGGDDQGAAAIAWPATEMLADARKFYALTMMAGIMNARLSDRLRAALGTSYAAQVNYWPSEVGPESRSTIAAFADIAPPNAGVFFDEISKIASDLRTTPASQEELDRAQKPRIANLTTSMALNGFWMHWLNLSQRDPRRLEFARNAISYLKSIKPEDVQRAADEFLKDDVAWKVVYHKVGAEMH
jgi:zinc protease